MDYLQPGYENIDKLSPAYPQSMKPTKQAGKTDSLK